MNASSPEPARSQLRNCPRCGDTGRPVGERTLRAILKPEAAAALRPDDWRFCRTPTCDVLYFAPGGAVFEKREAVTRIGIKETEDPIPLCYCFGFSRADVRSEVANAGDSTVPARIAAEVKAHRCACPIKNPSGACCLGEVNKAVQEAKQAVPRAAGEAAAAPVTGGARR
ncbi:MAG: copper chaperone Copz family protein [Myxococcus sp.]|jgi:hypothetical protein|nr:copper chaperone Copz family protein [Myxococcus sp.]MBM4780430.1 hypothetical protein [Archangiaceae bacterium]